MRPVRPSGGALGLVNQSLDTTSTWCQKCAMANATVHYRPPEPLKLSVVQKLSVVESPKLSLSDYSFDDRTLSDDHTLCATARMFTDMHLIDKFRIPYDVRPTGEF